MPLLATLTDNFNDGTLGPEWGNSYGGTTETGGRARVPCTTGYAGCQTGYAWTLAGSSFYVQIATVPNPTGATEAYCGVTVQAAVEGTRVGFIVNTITGMLRCVNETDYFDGSSVNITYSGVTHKYVRLRDDGTTLHWETSTDGSAWTSRRTLATPAWVTASIDTCALDMSAHRDAGTNDFAEFDSFNTLAEGAVHEGTADLTADSTLGAEAATAAIVGTDLTADSTLAAASVLTAHATADLTADSALAAETAGADLTDIDFLIGRPRAGWAVSGPWR